MNDIEKLARAYHADIAKHATLETRRFIDADIRNRLANEHDYFDANENMLTAFESAFNRPLFSDDESGISESDMDIINAASFMAQKHGFAVEWPMPIHPFAAAFPEFAERVQAMQNRRAVTGCIAHDGASFARSERAAFHNAKLAWIADGKPESGKSNLETLWKAARAVEGV